MGNLLVLEKLTKRFGHLLAVEDVSLSVQKGQVLGFLGPNGAGKSTTMKMISGFLEPTSGFVEVAGYDVVRNPVEVKQQIGYLPEGAPTYGDMTPSSFLSFIGEIRGFDGKERQSRIDMVVEKVRIKEVLFQPIETLSKGYKRRVGLAQAILHNPKILILDEPTDGLDPNQKHHVRGLINEMAQEKAIIVSTHILEEVEAVCSDVVIISGGRLIEKGTPEELLKRDPSRNSVVINFKKENLAQVKKVLGSFEIIPRDDQFQRRSALMGFQIMSKTDIGVLVSITDLIRKGKLPVEEVYLEKGTLDSVFRKITVQSEQEA